MNNHYRNPRRRPGLIFRRLRRSFEIADHDLCSLEVDAAGPLRWFGALVTLLVGIFQCDQWICARISFDATIGNHATDSDVEQRCRAALAGQTTDAAAASLPVARPESERSDYGMGTLDDEGVRCAD